MNCKKMESRTTMAERNKIAMHRETETKEKIYLELKRETTTECGRKFTDCRFENKNMLSFAK